MEPNPSETWDVVVVGSGPGGLTAAACLAASGRRVLVLEAHDLAGGNAQVFRRHHRNADGGRDEYEFDVGVHYLGDCGPGGLFPSIFAGLGMGERMRFLPLDPDGFDTLSFPDLTFVVPAGWDHYTERLVEAFPDERAGLERVVGVLRSVADEGRARAIPGVETPTFDQWAFRPLSELFAEGELSQRAQAVLDHWSGLYAGAPSQTAVAMHAGIIDHYMRGAYYPEGGGQMIPARLVQVLEAHGGEVRTLSPVRRIVVDAGCATGVELDDGSTIAADIVISNADHARTVFGLVGEQHWDPATVRWTRDATMTLGLVCVYLVLDLDLTGGPNTNYFVFPTYATEELYAGLDDGDLDPAEGVFAYIAMASRKDPENEHLCPAGQTNLQIMTLAPRGLHWWGVDEAPGDGGRYRRNPTYLERKAQLTEALIDSAEAVLADQLDGATLRDQRHQLRLRALTRAVRHPPPGAPDRDRRVVAGGCQHRVGARHRRGDGRRRQLRGRHPGSAVAGRAGDGHDVGRPRLGAGRPRRLRPGRVVPRRAAAHPSGPGPRRPRCGRGLTVGTDGRDRVRPGRAARPGPAGRPVRAR
jgi:phytoene dehydrogenase-like protein